MCYHIFRPHTGALHHHRYANEEVQLTASFTDGIRKIIDQRKKCKEKLGYFFQKLYCICCMLLWNKTYFFFPFIGILNSDFISGYRI